MATRNIIAVAALLAAVALNGPAAKASACAVDEYTHNNSLMEMQICDGGTFSISYTQPRPGMVQQGVRPGNLLINGQWNSDSNIAATARLFSGRCGEITYQVSGWKQGNTITLRGQAPVRNKNCRVVRRRQDNLLFVLSGGGAGGGGGPGRAVGDWHAIAGSFKSQQEAQRRANELGQNWYVMNTSACPNFTNGYWIATAGPYDRAGAQAFSARASHHGAYVKTCN